MNEYLLAYIGIGSNLDDPVTQVRNAIKELYELDLEGDFRASRLYRSAPMGPRISRISSMRWLPLEPAYRPGLYWKPCEPSRPRMAARGTGRYGARVPWIWISLYMQTLSWQMTTFRSPIRGYMNAPSSCILYMILSPR